jgi:hypothetical protein
MMPPAYFEGIGRELEKVKPLIRAKNYRAVKDWLEKASPRARDLGQKWMQTTVRNGGLKKLESLFKQAIETPAHDALNAMARTNDLVGIQQALKAGVDPFDAHSAMLWAFTHEHFEAAQCLWAVADGHEPDCVAQMAIDASKAISLPFFMQLVTLLSIEEQEDHVSKLIGQAARRGHLPHLQFLFELAEKRLPNDRVEIEKDALWEASHGQQQKSLRWLLDVRQVDPVGVLISVMERPLSDLDTLDHLALAVRPALRQAWIAKLYTQDENMAWTGETNSPGPSLSDSAWTRMKQAFLDGQLFPKARELAERETQAQSRFERAGKLPDNGNSNSRPRRRP